jgi:hypothetical protein
VATDVKAEKRFLSTIARRLDTLGAITRGQRQTGGQGLFRPEDNLESPYARDALRQIYRRIYRGDVAGWLPFFDRRLVAVRCALRYLRGHARTNGACPLTSIITVFGTAASAASPAIIRAKTPLSLHRFQRL